MRQQVVGGEEHAALGVQEDRVGGAVAGAVEDLERAVAQLDRVAVVQHPGDVGSRAPSPEGARHRLQRAHHVLGDAVAQHHVAGERVVGLRLLGEALHERHGDVDRGHLGAGVRRHQRDEPEVVDVLVGEDHQLDVLQRVAEGGDPAAQLVERGAGVGARVHQRQRLVLDQVDVHAADGERGGDRHAVHARRRGGGERVRRSRPDQRQHLVALLLHVLVGDQRLQVQAQQRLGVRRPHVEVPVLVVQRHPVELGRARRRRSGP